MKLYGGEMKTATIILFVMLMVGCSLTGVNVKGNFNLDGFNRTYIVHVPATGSNWPLVISMHGLYSSPINQQSHTRMDVIADREEFLVVYPKSGGDGWNFNESGPNDLGFINALIDTLAAKYSIDLNRVYATGMSSGGFMSHHLGCYASERIAAVAGVTGFLDCPSAPGRGVPVMQIHGTKDRRVAYSDAVRTINNWAAMNECPETPQSSAYPEDSTITTRDYYGPCKDNSEVILYTVNGMGHVWPGGFGVESWDIDASEEIWAFFTRHSLPDISATEALTVTFPNWGEALTAGSREEITWISAANIDNVKLEYDAGNGWQVIEASVPNNGSYAWTVPDDVSTSVTVRISDVAGEITDKSDEMFTIQSVTSISKRSMGAILGFEYVMSVSTLLPDNTITSYSLSHAGSSGRSIARGVIANPGQEGGQYAVVSDFKLDYLLDSTLKDSMIEVRIESREEDSDHVQLYWHPNPLTSRGALVYELVKCKAACKSQSRAGLYVGIIAGPIQSPVQIPVHEPGHYAIKLYRFDTMVPSSPWALFQVK